MLPLPFGLPRLSCTGGDSNPHWTVSQTAASAVGLPVRTGSGTRTRNPSLIKQPLYLELPRLVVSLPGMLIAIVPVLVLVIGILLWALATNPVLKEAGRIMFFCGLLVVCFVAARYNFRVL